MKKRRSRGGQITRSILIRYTFFLVLFEGLFVTAVIVARSLCGLVIWYQDNPIYWILKVLESTMLVWIPAICLLGWTIITYYYISKPVKYLNEVIGAAGQLANNPEEPIELSSSLRNVEDELNLVREEALRNAYAAKEAEKRKNDLIVYLAHDLKTPLTSVIGYLTLLRDEPEISREMRCRYTNIALEKAERLEELINEFFDITRFNFTEIALEPEKVNLSRMLEQITYEFIPILAEKNLKWKAEITSDVEMICDPDKLARVFDNLIRNAVNYSYVDSEILLKMKPMEDMVEIEVENRGKTISAEKLEHLFEQFFRADTARSSATGGAGLGLAISKEIVSLHNGSIMAFSEDERILFTIKLPLDCKKNVRNSEEKNN
ncbi:MAG: HAMP domain-containing histidine kinase [Lachnospiraceae bacterium]|nr:HAMP domain-containing histidine kinase [Lachnospiraceae bacterium]